MKLDGSDAYVWRDPSDGWYYTAIQRQPASFVSVHRKQRRPHSGKLLALAPLQRRERGGLYRQPRTDDVERVGGNNRCDTRASTTDETSQWTLVDVARILFEELHIRQPASQPIRIFEHTLL